VAALQKQSNELKKRCVVSLTEAAEEIEKSASNKSSSYGEVEYFEHKNFTAAVTTQAILFQTHDNPDSQAWIPMSNIVRIDVGRAPSPYVMNLDAAALLTNAVTQAQAGWNLYLQYFNDAGYAENLTLNFTTPQPALRLKDAIDSRMTFINAMNREHEPTSE
jgi:hypothetical protein